MMKERLAVALEDLDRVAPELRVKLLKGRLDLDNVLRHAGQHREEEVPAVPFTCDLLTAAIACDVLRSNDRKLGDELTRVYVLRESRWTRVTSKTVLTVIVEGKVRLNPEVFSIDKVVGAPPPRRAAF